MDVGTGLALLGGVKSLEKLLGPTIEYLGKLGQAWVERRVQNINRIFSIAVTRLGDKIESEGCVPPRVLKAIIDEGSFCEDSVTAEYLGGVLASSRSGVSRDDRAVCFVRLIARLSSYQVRTHYILYHVLKGLFDGECVDPGLTEGRYAMRTFVPAVVYDGAMSFDKRENTTLITDHALCGLVSENLIDSHEVAWGPAEVIRESCGPDDGGILFMPSPRGIELFLMGYGRDDLDITRFLNANVHFDCDQSVVIVPGALRVRR